MFDPQTTAEEALARLEAWEAGSASEMREFVGAAEWALNRFRNEWGAQVSQKIAEAIDVTKGLVGGGAPPYWVRPRPPRHDDPYDDEPQQDDPRWNENRKTANPASNPDTDRACALFIDFHQFEPRKVDAFPREFKIPSRMWYVGNPTTMYYTSDKLNPTTGKDEGKVQYYHDHGKGNEAPRIYLSDRFADDEGGELRAIPQWIRADDATLCLIGQGDGIDFKNFEGEKIEYRSTRPYPKWWATSNGKALLLIQGDREVLAIIWGGRLRVEPRGVVG